MSTIPTTTPFGDPYRNHPNQPAGPPRQPPPSNGGVTSTLPQQPGYHGHPNPPPSPNTGPPGTVDTSGGTAEQQDAFATLMGVLDEYDLGDLGKWAWGELVSGRSSSGIQLDLRDQPAFRQRFKVIFDRQKAGLTPISPTDVINYESAWHQMTKAAGLPDSFGARDTAQKLLGADVSLSEAQARVDQGYRQMQQAPQEVRDMFNTYFGVQGSSALAAYFTDAALALPDLERKVSEAQIGGAGSTQGFNVSETMADRLARVGVSGSQAESGFSKLNQERDLFSASVGDTSSVSTEQGISAEFGLSGEDATNLAKLSEQRQAAFGGRSETAADQSGLTGTGQARSV